MPSAAAVTAAEFSGRMFFASGFNVDGEVAIALRSGESVMLFQSVDLRFRDGRDLAFVSVKRGQAGGQVALTANGTKSRDQLRGFRPGSNVIEIVRRNAEGRGELPPELRVIRFTGFLVDQVGKQLAPGRLIVTARMHGREISRESGDVLIILASIIGQRLFAQFTSCPGEVKGMREQMAGGDLF